MHKGEETQPLPQGVRCLEADGGVSKRKSNGEATTATSHRAWWGRSAGPAEKI